MRLARRAKTPTFKGGPVPLRFSRPPILAVVTLGVASSALEQNVDHLECTPTPSRVARSLADDVNVCAALRGLSVSM